MMFLDIRSFLQILRPTYWHHDVLCFSRVLAPSTCFSHLQLLHFALVLLSSLLILLIFPTMTDKALSFSSYMFGTPVIIVNRLKGSNNYQSRANSIKLWFTGNGVEDHLTSTESSVPEDKRSQWRKRDALLCNILQQSIDPKTLDNLGDYQTCQPLWT